MTEYTRGRATTYKGVRMRSRLEASFAAWLDGKGIHWLYEPGCFADETGQYLPDFCSKTSVGITFYYEVKPPTADTSAALRKMHVIRASEPKAIFFVVVPTGVYPNQKWTTAGQCIPGEEPCAHCTGVAFRDQRTIPNPNRVTIGGRARRETVPTDPVTGRATIGGRARRADGTRP